MKKYNWSGMEARIANNVKSSLEEQETETIIILSRRKKKRRGETK